MHKGGNRRPEQLRLEHGLSRAGHVLGRAAPPAHLPTLSMHMRKKIIVHVIGGTWSFSNND